MVIYELDRGQIDHEEDYVACGVRGVPPSFGPWAYDDDGALLGWICEDCFEGGTAYMKERLREQARDLHRIACDKDSLSDNDIRYARPGTSPAIP